MGSGDRCRKPSGGPACPLSFSSPGTMQYRSSLPAGTYPRCPTEHAECYPAVGHLLRPLHDRGSRHHSQMSTPPTQLLGSKEGLKSSSRKLTNPPRTLHSQSLASACTPPETGSSLPPEAARSVLNSSDREKKCFLGLGGRLLSRCGCHWSPSLRWQP